MRTRWLLVLAVVLAASAIVVYKQGQQIPREGASRASLPAAGASGPSVLLFADPREVDGADPCAEIFRLVRRAGARGIRVSEFEAKTATGAARQYGVTVEPTVLVLDTEGHVVARHEGESRETIAAIRGSLERLSPAP